MSVADAPSLPGAQWTDTPNKPPACSLHGLGERRKYGGRNEGRRRRGREIEGKEIREEGC